MVNGENFPSDLPPTCVFGTLGDSSYTQGIIINDQKIMCPSPATLGDISAIPFTLTFGDLNDGKTINCLSILLFKVWDQTDITYQYYTEPEIIDMFPKEANIGETTLIRFISSNRRPFNSCKLCHIN